MSTAERLPHSQQQPLRTETTPAGVSESTVVENMPENSVLQFYEGMVGEYHLLFADWRQEVFRQGRILDTFMQRQLGNKAQTVLDCTCGIGTQAIGLAAQGYAVHATDLSPAAVGRARQEAAALGLALTCAVADLRTLASTVPGVFDVVLSCDNALSHLHTDTELFQAAAQMQAKLRPGGLLLATIRDYDRLVAAGSDGVAPAVASPPGDAAQVGSMHARGTVPRVFDDTAGRRISFQVWDWAADRRSYAVHQFFVRETPSGWQTTHYATTYRALLRRELSDILHNAGFTEVCWHMPEDSGYYQPIVTAHKR